MQQHLLQKIAKGQTKEVLKALLDLVPKFPNSHLAKEILLQSSRFEQYAKEKRAGISSSEQQNLSLNRINQSIIEIIQQLPDETDELTNPPKQIEQSLPSTNSTTTPLWKYITGAALIIGMLGSIAEVLNFINIIPNKTSESTQLTIYVHGSKGIQDYVLEGEGELLVDFDGDRRYAKIGEKGRTVFNEIPSKFIGQALPISVKANRFVPVEPNKKFTWDGKPIYFPIKVDPTLLQIKGIVKNRTNTKFLKNVSILINQEWPTTTDSMGRFQYTVPENQLQEYYSLRLQKEGYLPKEESYYPGSSKEFRLEIKE